MLLLKQEVKLVLLLSKLQRVMFPARLSGSQSSSRSHSLLVSGESQSECQDECEDLYDEGANDGGQENTLLVAHHCW